MKTGTPRIVLGAIITALFGLGTLRNLVVLPMTIAAYGATPYLIGSVVGAAVAVLVLVLGIRMLRQGLRQRRALALALARPVVPGRF